MRKTLWVMLSCFLITACVTKNYYVYMTPSAVDKTAGVVTMEYSYNSSQNPIVDYDTALKDASFQCRLIGYETARVTEDFHYNCLDSAKAESCNGYRVTIGYRCLSKQEVIDEAENAAKGIGHTEVDYVPVQ